MELVVARTRTSGALAGFGRRVTVVLMIVSLLGLATIAGVVRTETHAGAAGIARNGLTAETAAPSCWSIKQSYPASADGIYWLWTPALIEPQQFHCDMTTEGGGWVLVGRGREAWSFQYWGQGSPSTVRSPITGPEAFAPATLPTPTVDGLMNGGRMDNLNDGIRLRRATNATGTTWQEVRMRVKTYGSWSWAFGGGIYLSSVKFDATTTNLATSNFQSSTTANVQTANDTRRVFTYPWSNHNLRAGFSFGSSVTTGSNAATSYLWEYANENSAIPFTQVYIRPQISEADIVAAGVSNAPDTGIAGSTVKAMLDHRPTPQPWGVTGINNGTSIPSLNANVTAFADIGSTIYVGGKFLQVQHGVGGEKFTQSYLAAFDKTTGEWIPTFNPVLDGPVWEIKAAPDGTKLFVGGEFTSVNSVANTSGLAALSPDTGAPAAGWLGYVSRTTGASDVRTMDIQSGFLYIGGQFNRVAGGIDTQFLGPIVVGRLARLRLTDGRPDGTWKPNVETAPQDIDASAQGDRVYVVGLFQTLNGVTLTPSRLAVIDTTTAEAVPGLEPFKPNTSTATEWQNAILEVGNKVYQGGSQHFIHQYNRSDYAFERSHMTKTGGDYQAIAYRDGIIYGACHCNDWQYQDANTWSDPMGYSRVDPINMIGAYDTTNNFEVLPEFHTTQLDLTGADGEGPWELFVDSDNCMWAGGDLVRLGTTPTPFYGGFERFCGRDATAPAAPPNSNAAVAGNDVNLTWNASTDNATTPIRYEILKDDPTFGTIVMGTTFERSFTDTGVVGPARYFIRSVDAEGNRSATTPVLAVTPPPPAAATLLAHGATWSYRADGQDLGTTWRQPAFNTSTWATGASQLGWGGKGETTLIPSGPVTSYFVKHQTIANPSQYETITIRLKRDDGAAVYVNGLPVVLDNVPAGALTASTPATSFTSGVSESTWFEHQVPASLFTAGDNTIAVEVHQGGLNNADAVFDLELIARNGSETTAPSAPAPIVTDIDFSSATIGWAPSTDDAAVIGYIVRRNGTPVTFTKATTFSDTGLAPATAYAYAVTAVDTSGNQSTPGSVNTSTVANPAVVSSGDIWSYRSTTTDPGVTWRQPGFDVSSWPTGPSQLGWGGKGEATVVPNNTATQYYVHHFSIDDPSQYQRLLLRLVRDDAAAVYINGIEVRRDNLAAGPLTYATRSASAMTAPAERAWYETTLPGALLVTGDNVIAVEVHQDTATNVDSLFDLELVRQTPAETNPPTLPALTVSERTSSSLSFGWAAATDDSGILGYIVRRNGLILDYTSETSFTETGLAANTAYTYQVVAVDSSGNQSTPRSLLASTLPALLVQIGDTWAYRSTATDPGTTWRQLSFNSSSWTTGPSQLGWGNRGEDTLVPSGNVAQYYLRHITVADPSEFGPLTIRLKRDDGIAVYINGTEVIRDNLPAGTLTAATFASTKVTAADGVNWKTFTVPSTALVAGDNVIAAEVHQDAKTDTRSVFQLEIRASTAATAPVVTIASPTEASTVQAPTTLSGVCTAAAGTVTVNITGAQSSIVTTDCVADAWTASTTLPDGTYNATAAQTAAGETGTSAARSFTVDAVAPAVTLTSPANGALSDSTQTFAGACSTADGNVRVGITGSATATLTTACTAGAWSVASGALGTGSYSATATQTDAAGNTGTSAARSFTIDAAAPATTDNTASIGNGWKTTTQVVTLTATDAGGAGVAQTYYTTNGSTPTTASATGTTIELAGDGVYTIKYFTVDAVGNAEPVRTAATQIRIDKGAPVTTDNAAALSEAWTNANTTVTLTTTDANGVAATYYTTTGADPTTSSAQGTSILLSTTGTYTIKYFSVDAAGNAEEIKTLPVQIRIDKNLPVTTDSSAAIGTDWKTTSQTLTLTPSDAGGSGLVGTYYTTNGTVPTASSDQGTSVVLSTAGIYTVKYASRDAAGNIEGTKTAGLIRIDTAAPTNTMTFPVNGARYNSAGWTAGCSPTARICGTATDATSGVASVQARIQRSNNNQYWNGSGWQAASTTVTATGTTAWSIPLATSQLANGVTYTVTTWTVDAAGRVSPNTVRSFTYDTVGPTTAAASITTTNKNGAISTADTFAVTFNEAINAASVPATATLTLSRSNGNTSYGISGLTNGLRTTGTTGYLTSSGTTRTVTYTGTLTLTGTNTITFKVTGACAGSCTALSTTARSGGFQFVPATTLKDVAGNAPSTSTITASSQVIF